MTERGTWDSEWRALAEKELRGAPFASLTPARHDGLTIDPALGPDARDEGLNDALGTRALLVVTDRDADVPLASEVDGLWWRGADRRDARIHEPPGADVVATPGETIFLTAAHEHGASPVTEVAIGISAMVRGAATSSVRFAVAVGPELFVEIAKLRALRRLSRRVLAAIDAAETPIEILARSSERCMSLLDAPTNVVRTTLAAAAAMIGGATQVGVLAMDAVSETRSPLAARLARNVGVVLARESSLFDVEDPARGSFEIEALTDRIARQAWALACAARNDAGVLRARVEADAEARRRAVRSRRIPIVGVSKHPPVGASLTAAPSSLRDAAPFEAVRARAATRARLVIVGAREAVEARVAFVRELLEVGGVAIGDDAPVAVVCAPDAAFGTELVEALIALRDRGVRAFVAGKPGAHEAALRAAGAEGFVALGSDVVAFYDALQGAA